MFTLQTVLKDPGTIGRKVSPWKLHVVNSLSLKIMCQHIMSSATQKRCGMFLKQCFFSISGQVAKYRLIYPPTLINVLSVSVFCLWRYIWWVSPHVSQNLIPWMAGSLTWVESPCQMRVQIECWAAGTETWVSLMICNRSPLPLCAQPGGWALYMFLHEPCFCQHSPSHASHRCTPLMNGTKLELCLSWLILALSLISPYKFLIPNFCLPKAQFINLAWPPYFVPMLHIFTISSWLIINKGKSSKGSWRLSFINWGAEACLLHQEATASHPRGSQHCSTKGINTPPSPAPAPEYWEAQGKVLEQRGLSI